MKIEWKNEHSESVSLKRFLEEHGVSHRMYAALKEHPSSFRLNGKTFHPDQLVEKGDVIAVDFPPEKNDPRVITSNGPVEIIYEDNNWLVINKPAGLTSVPGPADSEDTLVNRIKGHLINENAENLRPHVITRLDRFTSGVVLVAKNHLANSYANQELTNHDIDKRYIALVKGKMDENHAIIDKPVGRIGDNYFREVTEDGKQAKTEYWVKKTFPEFTLVELKLHTGRTHQIRVHMTDIGHPLLGDQLYGGPMNLEMDHQALHAESIKFYDPFQEKDLEFTAAMPDDIKNLIQ